MVKYIVDLSHHQDPKNFNYDVFAQNIRHAIIRTQYGSKTVDRYYKTHHAELRKRGIGTSAYAWVRGVSENDMRVEARDFFNRTKDLKPLAWVLDVEEKSMANMRAGIKAYVDELRKLGVTEEIGVYIAHHLYKPFNLDLNDFDFVWIPRYGANNGQMHDTKPSYPCDLWQFTSQGRLDGYNGVLDLNVVVSNKPLRFLQSAQPTPQPSPSGNIGVGSIVTVAAHATHYQTGQPIASFVKGNRYKVMQVKDVNQSNSKKAFLLDGIMSWVLEQDIVEAGGQAAAPQPQAKKRYIILPANATNWTVYKLDRPPVKANKANIAGTLRPSKFGGLTYEILDDLGGHVYKIRTGDFGVVKIYGAPSTGARIVEK